MQDAIVLAQKAELQSLADELQTVQTEVKTTHTRIADLTLKTQGELFSPAFPGERSCGVQNGC